MMRNRFLYLALLAVVALQGCNREDRTELFEMSHVMEFQVVAGLNTVETHFFIQPNAASSYDDLLETVVVSDEDVDAIEPKFSELTTVFGDIDLDFIRAIEVRVYDAFDASIVSEVFYLDPVPGNTRSTIRPFPGLADVKHILSEPRFGVEVRLRFIAPPPTTMDMRLFMNFSAFANE